MTVIILQINTTCAKSYWWKVVGRDQMFKKMIILCIHCTLSWLLTIHRMFIAGLVRNGWWHAYSSCQVVNWMNWLLAYVRIQNRQQPLFGWSNGWSNGSSWRGSKHTTMHYVKAMNKENSCRCSTYLIMLYSWSTMAIDNDLSHDWIQFIFMILILILYLSYLWSNLIVIKRKGLST